jgi:hypothetical protein
MLAHRGVTPVRHRSQLSSDTLAVMEDLDGARGDAPTRSRAAANAARNNADDFDMMVEADIALLPFRAEVGLDRQRLELGRSTSNSARRLVPRCRHARVELGDEIDRQV